MTKSNTTVEEGQKVGERFTPALVREMWETLLAHDQYMFASGYCGPEDSSLHPNAATNWLRIRRILRKVEGLTKARNGSPS